MSKDFRHLKKNIIINKKIFKNRIISSPISINMAKDGFVTSNIVNFFLIWQNQVFRWLQLVQLQFPSKVMTLSME